MQWWNWKIIRGKQGTGIVDGVRTMEIPGEGDKENEGIEGNQGGGDIEALRGVVDG